MNIFSRPVLILGVTASGKGRLAHALAKAVGGEIVSIDSMKVYRRMDIGTAKPSASARSEVPYHMIDVVEPSESFSVGKYVELAGQAITEIQARSRPVIFVGGTAMYIKAMLCGLFEGPGTNEEVRACLRARMAAAGPAALHRELALKDPESAQRIHPNDAKRIIRALEVMALTGRPLSEHQQQWRAPVAAPSSSGWTAIGLRRDRQDASHRINLRVRRMFEEGLVEEVRSLLDEPLPLSKQARCAIGYAEVIDYLSGRRTMEETVELVKKNTRKLAKAQRTWFKTFSQVQWVDAAPEESTESLLARTLQILEATA
jgi:tRNA dimethylallyltransferase